MLLCCFFDLCTHGRGELILTHRHTRSLPPRIYLTFRFPSLFTLSFGGRMQQQMRITPSLPSCIWRAHSRKFGFPSPVFGGIAFPTPSLSQNFRLHTITIWLRYSLCLYPIFGFEFYVLFFLHYLSGIWFVPLLLAWPIGGGWCVNITGEKAQSCVLPKLWLGYVPSSVVCLHFCF